MDFTLEKYSHQPYNSQPDEHYGVDTMAEKIQIQYQDIFGTWKHLTTMHHAPSAYRSAKQKAKQMKKRLRLIDEQGHLLDLLDP